jgi:hypothetical protein
VQIPVRHVAASSDFSRCFETLERRVLLHAAIFHAMPADLAALVVDGHIPASKFIQARPQFANTNIWSPAVFNPTNSMDPKAWLYDPHWIENDIFPNELPTTAESRTGGPEADSLPDLIPLTGGGFLSPFIDTTEIPGHNLMRFTTGVGNQGAGPAILTSANSGTNPLGQPWVNADGTQNVLQAVYSYSGTAFGFDHYRQAGRMVWHNGHGHFHLEGYARYRLLTNVGGNPGPVAIRSGFDNQPATGDKVGFCLVNINASFTMTNGQSSTTLPGYDPVGDQSHASTNGQPLTTCGFTQGIHVGHADVYSSIYDGQWIDVTGVPNGSYFLEVTLDANNVIQETNDANNTVVIPVTLNANPPAGGIQPDRFEPNNDFASATDLGVLGQQTQSGLTIHVTNEDDYFKFVAASSGSYQVKLNIGDRDVNLYLYDNNQALLTSSTSINVGPTTETVNWNFVAGQTYYVRAEGFGSALNPTTSGVSSNYALQVAINPTVGATLNDGVSNEIGDFGHIFVDRNGPTSSPLTVNFGVSGSAVRGSDYDIYMGGVLIAGNSFTIGNEAQFADLEIRPIADGVVENTESMTLTLNTDAAYVLGANTSASVNIGDTPPAVTQTVQTWQTNPHKVAFTFNLDVAGSIDAGDLTVLNLDTNQPVNPASFVYNAGTKTATATFAGILPDGHYRATLNAAGITHALGLPMAANFVYNFFVLTADANHDGHVDLLDFNILGQNFGQTGRDGSTGDFDYDGDVDLADFNILSARFGTSSGPSSRLSPTNTFGTKRIDDSSRTQLDLLA